MSYVCTVSGYDSKGNRSTREFNGNSPEECYQKMNLYLKDPDIEVVEKTKPVPTQNSFKLRFNKICKILRKAEKIEDYELSKVSKEKLVYIIKSYWKMNEGKDKEQRYLDTLATAEKYDPEFARNLFIKPDKFYVQDPEGESPSRDTRLETIYEDVVTRLHKHVKNGKIEVYRGMAVSPEWLKKLSAGDTLGIYWTYDKEKAEPYAVSTDENIVKIVFHGTISEEDINWDTTILYNMHGDYQDEHEIRVLKDTPITMIDLKVKDSMAGLFLEDVIKSKLPLSTLLYGIPNRYPKLRIMMFDWMEKYWLEHWDESVQKLKTNLNFMHFLKSTIHINPAMEQRLMQYKESNPEYTRNDFAKKLFDLIFIDQMQTPTEVLRELRNYTYTSVGFIDGFLYAFGDMSVEEVKNTPMYKRLKELTEIEAPDVAGLTFYA